MGKVLLKIPPWIASLLNAESSDWFILEREIGDGATTGDVLTELTSSYEGFRRAVFNPDLSKVSDQLMIFLNDSLLQDREITEAKLKDGDSIMLLNVYAGG